MNPRKLEKSIQDYKIKGVNSKGWASWDSTPRSYQQLLCIRHINSTKKVYYESQKNRKASFVKQMVSNSSWGNLTSCKISVFAWTQVKPMAYFNSTMSAVRVTVVIITLHYDFCVIAFLFDMIEKHDRSRHVRLCFDSYLFCFSSCLILSST